MSSTFPYYESLPPEQPGGQAYVERLSPRELQVVQHLFNGCSNRNVATLLDVSIKTIEKHRQSIMRKLGIRSTAILIRLLCREEHLLKKLTSSDDGNSANN